MTCCPYIPVRVNGKQVKPNSTLSDITRGWNFSGMEGTRGKYQQPLLDIKSCVPSIGVFYNKSEVNFIKGEVTSHRSRDLSETIDEIYQECSVINWDGYGAKPVDYDLRKTVEQFLNSLPTIIPDPEISADPDGEISLDWCSEPRKVFTCNLCARLIISKSSSFVVVATIISSTFFAFLTLSIKYSNIVLSIIFNKTFPGNLVEPNLA